jgi:ribosome recycling factor
MSSFFRTAIRPLHPTSRASFYASNLTRVCSPVSRSLQSRYYAKRKDKDEDNNKPSKSKKAKHNAEDEIVHSRNNINDPSLKFVPSSALPYGAEYDVEKRSADEKFQSSLKWLKEQARGVEIRSSGRVVPDILDGVKVMIESEEGGQNDFEVGLKEIATVGVKNGNVLVVTVFEEQVSLLLR